MTPNQIMAGPEFSNPIIRGFHPDPTICRVGEDYWLVVSSFEYFPGLPVFHSRDLVNWRLAGHALSRPDQLDLSARQISQGIFAPTLRYHNGTFYLITTEVGGIGNFILTTQDPAGPWSDPVCIEEGDAFTWFDPSLHFDEDGTVYYTRRQEFHVVQAEIDVTTGQLLTPLRKIADPHPGDDIEGPHLYRIGEYYYLLCAEGGTGWGHAIRIGRSRSRWGPFDPCPHNPILTHRHLTNHSIRSTGHGDLIEAHDGSWWMVFLATRHREECGFPFHHMGRETFLAPVAWKDGWPIVNAGKPIQYRMPGPSLPRRESVCPSPCDPFIEPSLDPRWISRRKFPLEAVEFRPGGGLRLHGNTATLNDSTSPAFLARRIEEPVFTITTYLRFDPESDGAEAGLCLFMSEAFHAEIAVLRKNQENYVIVRRRAADLQAVVVEIHVPRNEWILQVTGDWDGFTFTCQSPDGSPIASHHADRRLLCTELAMGWTGLVAGLYATTNGNSGPCSAEFPYFSNTMSLG